MRYEILDGESVINTIVASPEFMAAQYPSGSFREASESEPAPPAPVQRHITVGSFFDRFAAHKWPILADTNPLVQALIKDCSVRKHIDLDDPQLPAGLGLLVQAGHEIDPAAIISAPVLPSEVA